MRERLLACFLLLARVAAAQQPIAPKGTPTPNWFEAIELWFKAFLKAKGDDLIVSFFGTLLAFATAIWIYRWQVADADATAKRQTADQLATEARQAAEALSTERRREFEALAAERRQATEALVSEKRQASQAKEAELLAIQQRRIDHIRWLTGILKQVIGYATDQADRLDELTAAIAKDPSELYSLGIIASSSIQRLTRADNEATFHAYNTVFAEVLNKDEQYKDLLKYTDFSTAQINDLLTRFSNYQKNIYDRQLSLKFMIEQAANGLATLKVSMDFGGAKANYFGQPFYKDTNDLLLLYGQLITKSEPFKKIQTDFVKPLLTLLLTERHFPGANELTRKLKDFNTGFTDLQHESINFKAGLNTKQLRASSDKLEEIRKRLEEGYTAAETALSKIDLSPDIEKPV